MPKLLSSFHGIPGMLAENQGSEKTSLENSGLVYNEMARMCKYLWPHWLSSPRMREITWNPQVLLWDLKFKCGPVTFIIRSKFLPGQTCSNCISNTGLFISPSGISDPCGTVAGMVTPKGIMSTERETHQVSVLPYRCSIC